MHELSITRNVVAIVCERAPGQRIKRVRLEIGRLSAIEPDAIQFCFDICAQGTTAEGALLEIMQISGRGACDACGAEAELTAPTGCCPNCGAPALRLIAGEELNIKEMEVATCA